MAYEIPQQLQHKERILFGLTFSQTGWLILFGGITLLLILRPGDVYTNLILALFPAILGVLFIFFDLFGWIKRIKNFTSFRQATQMSSKMTHLLQIKRIEDNAIITNQKIGILELMPINFKIKTEDEQETIINGFQKFLNGLDFKVQFLITTTNLDLNSYLDKLSERTKNKQILNDFRTFLTETINKNAIRNRQFYLIIPENSDLDIQIELGIERLKQIGILSRKLKDRQLLSMLQNFFDNKREETQEISNSLQYLIAPKLVKDQVDSLQLNDSFCRIITANGFPRSVEPGFLDKIISSNDEFDISIHIEPFAIETMMVMLNQELQKQRADLYAEELKRSINPSLEIKYQDTKKILDELQKGKEKLFNVSLYINCRGKTKKEVELLSRKVEAELNSLMIIPSNPIFNQKQAYQSIFPTANNQLNVKRNIPTNALSAFFPLTSPFLSIEDSGVMLGLNKNKVPLIRDIYKLSNANGIVLATSGSGKSYFTKLLIARQMLNGTKVTIIDPQSEYLGLVQECKGEIITISRTSKTIINPLDLMGHDFVEKKLALLDIFKVMFGDLSEIQRAILDRAVTETYAKKSITMQSWNNKKPPILSDLYKELEQMSKKATSVEKMTYSALLNRLYMYTEGVFSFLNRQTTIDFDNDLVCFNIGDMPKQVKPTIMYLILDFVYMKMKSSKERKLLVVDEAWSLLSQTSESSYIFEIVKTCRKFNLGLLLITQDVADLLSSKAGSAVLANSSYSLLLRQKPAVIDSVVKTFRLSNLEKEYLLSAQQGRGILITDNEHQELEVIASPAEHKLITTNADEIVSSEKKETNHEEISIQLDLEKGLYHGTELRDEDKNYLINHGYEGGFFVSIGKVRQEEFWVKKNGVESLEHTFLVQNIKHELLKITKDVQVYISEKPDIVFTYKQLEYCIEVETLKHLQSSKKQLINKIVENKHKYGSRCIYVINDRKGKPILNTLNPSLKVLLRKDVPAYLKELKNS
jgi:conjugal transfer ATP-binding protein TraC